MRILTFLAIIFFCCSHEQSKAQINNRRLKILFVGNSLTYTNSLPGIIQELGKQDGVEIQYQSLLFPDYSLEDHLNDGKIQDEIKNGKYDFVVTQQGPSALPESQALLLTYSEKIAELCKTYKAQFALYMVWPSKARLFDLDNVIYSYTHAAEVTGALLLPAGKAWKQAWTLDSTSPLYGADNFHPSVTGSLLAALTIYGRLAGKNNFDFIQYDSISWHDEIPIERLITLKQAAAAILKAGD